MNQLGSEVLNDESNPTRPPVGVPIWEQALTDRASEYIYDLVRPGVGRQLFVIPEADIGAGRPDLLVLSVSPRALANHLANGPRVPTLVSAGVALGEDPLPVSQSYQRTISRVLAELGISQDQARQAAGIVGASLAIEVKVRDWQRALGQAVKYRPIAGATALALPQRAAARVPAERLHRYGTGVISLSDDSPPQWRNYPLPGVTTPTNSLWLLELLSRAIETGAVYTPSRRRKSASASPITLTRVR
jgi:hypothetical protein